MATKTVTSNVSDPRMALEQSRLFIDETLGMISQRESLDQQIKERLGRVPMNLLPERTNGNAQQAVAKIVASTKKGGGKKPQRPSRRADGPSIADLCEQAMIKASKEMTPREVVNAIMPQYNGRSKDPYNVVLNELRRDRRFKRHRHKGGVTTYGIGYHKEDAHTVEPAAHAT